MSNPTVSPLMQARPAQALEWFVLVETGSLAGRRFPLTSTAGSLTLGREGDCTIRFDPHQERMVGRHHARIEVRADGVYLVDTNSANGTFKNGEAVSEARLQHGDRFQLGGEVDELQGPWVSIHLPVAVHLLPMSTDAATMVIRPSAPSPAGAQKPAPQVADHQPPPIDRAATEVFRPPVTPTAPPAPYAPLLPREPERLPAAAVPRGPAAAVPAVDPLHRERRAALFRQVAAIVLLLVLSCGAGVALGLYDSSDADAESTTGRE